VLKKVLRKRERERESHHFFLLSVSLFSVLESVVDISLYTSSQHKTVLSFYPIIILREKREREEEVKE